MLGFEEFMLDSFPGVFNEHLNSILESIPSKIDRVRNKAIYYLECQCSGKYGFLAEAHDDIDIAKSDSTFMIPSSYESALILPYIMNEGLDRSVVENVVSFLKRSRRSSGFWNYFFDPEHRSHSLIPDDIDDTALPAVALYFTGGFSLRECQDLARDVIKNRLVDLNTNAITTWIPDKQRQIIFSRYQEVPKLCAGCLTNLLWFMAIIGMETEPEILPSIDFVSSFIDTLMEDIGIDKEELQGLCYYTRKYTVFFFLARFVQKSEYARKKFGQKFVNVLLEEFEIFVEKPNIEALDIAFMTLAVWHLNLHKVKEQNWVTNEKKIEKINENIKSLCKRLLTLQDKDGSFRAWNLYRWNKIGHWGGTKAATTGLVLAVLGIAKREIFTEEEINAL